jgi:hypothetical protein
MTKPLNFLIDAATRYAHQLGDQGITDDAVCIKLGVELAIERWGASQKDAKFLRDNTPPVREGAIPPHNIEWKPERKFGRAVIIVKAPYALFRMAH